MNSFDFYFGLLLGDLLLYHSDNLSKTLEATRMSAIDGQNTLQSTRSDDNFFKKSQSCQESKRGQDDMKMVEQKVTH